MLISGHSTWALDRDHIDAVRMAVLGRTMPTQAALTEARDVQAKALKQVKGRVAVLPIYGLIEQRLSELGYLCGGTSTELIGEALDRLVASRDVEVIICDYATPGGISYGIEELSAQIFEARAHKRIIGIANSMAASAGYWLYSAASECYATPGGDIGSIGVYSLHIDLSKALEKDGVEVELIRAGQFKAENNPYQPLTDDAREHLQEQVDDTYTAFVRDVARNRGVSIAKVREGFGQGRVVSAPKAVAAGMADRVLTLPKLLGRLTGNVAAGQHASAEVLRLRHEWRKTAAAGRPSLTPL